MLDTDTCIYIKNRRPPHVIKRFSRLQDGEVVMSLVTFGELLNGALISNQSSSALKKINQLATILPVQDMTADVAKHYASIRRSLEKTGNIIGANNLWIAAHAVALDLTLVTNNTDEFSRVDGLRVENWV
jgi:tRNA(fMet)-specific endonuclease VapC